jgi:hypothetical protein
MEVCDLDLLGSAATDLSQALPTLANSSSRVSQEEML